MSKCIFLFKYKDLDVPKEAVNHQGGSKIVSRIFLLQKKPLAYNAPEVGER